jgi:homoserine acetyltransferase
LAFDLGPRDADRFQTEVLEVRDHIGKHLLVRFDAACATYRNVHFMDAHDCDKYNDKSKADLFTVLKEIYDCTLQARPVA